MPDKNFPVEIIKIGGKTVKIGDMKKDIDLTNLHVAQEVQDIFSETYDRNFDSKISTKSSASIFSSDLKELIGDDNSISDEEIEAFIKKKELPFLNKADIKKELTELFSNENNNLFQGTVKPIKIGDRTIYIGDKINKEIDLSRYYRSGTTNSRFLYLYENRDTQKIGFETEAEKLYRDLKAMCNENNEITDEKIQEYISSNPKLKGVSPKLFVEFISQILAPEKTEEEKQAYFEQNKQRINSITQENNLLNSPSADKNINLAKDIINTFKKRYGTPYSPSMQMLIEKEYYRHTEQASKISNLRAQGLSFGSLEDCHRLSEFVTENKTANCQEDAALTCLILKEKYPDKQAFVVSYDDVSGLSDTGHTAVMIFDDSEQNTEDFYSLYENLQSDSDLSKYKKGYVIDNWLGGIYRADEWIKMQKQLHDSQAFTISSYINNIR